MNSNLMDQFASTYQSDFTQKQEPSKMNSTKKYFGSFNPLNTNKSENDLEGTINMSTHASESADAPQQKSSGGGLMSLFQK